MKKFLSTVLVATFLVSVTACSNKHIDQNSNNTLDKNQVEQNNNIPNVSYQDLGGANDVKLYPIDEANQNPDFKKFRDELLAAIKQKNLSFIKEHTDETIKYSFGANDKLKGFLSNWNLDTNPNESKFWDEMNKVLSLGGTFNDPEKTIFTAPYTFTRFPEKFDAFQYYAIIDKDVKVYSSPDLKSNIDGKLNYSIVKFMEKTTKSETIDGKTYTWLKIETPSGKTGFVLDKYLRSPIDYRASFKNFNGTWKLIFFVAGD